MSINRVFVDQYGTSCLSIDSAPVVCTQGIVPMFVVRSRAELFGPFNTADEAARWAETHIDNLTLAPWDIVKTKANP